jgi:hypothetical protein
MDDEWTIKGICKKLDSNVSRDKSPPNFYPTYKQHKNTKV